MSLHSSPSDETRRSSEGSFDAMFDGERGNFSGLTGERRAINRFSRAAVLGGITKPRGQGGDVQKHSFTTRTDGKGSASATN